MDSKRRAKRRPAAAGSEERRRNAVTMKKRRIKGTLLGVCLLLVGCGAGNEEANDFPAEVGEEAMGKETMGEETVSGQAFGEQEEVCEAYGTFLAACEPQGTESGNAAAPGFALAYLDADEIPELVVIEGDAHMCGASLYTFEEGEVILVGTYGQYGTLFYLEKEGIVFDSRDSFGDVYEQVYRIEGTEETLLQSYSEVWASSAEEETVYCTYTVDGEEVSEEQYRTVCGQWEKKREENDCREITYGGCRKAAGGDIGDALMQAWEEMSP